MCAKYYDLRCMFLKYFTSFMLVRLLDKLVTSKLALFSVSGLKDEMLIKSKHT